LDAQASYSSVVLAEPGSHGGERAGAGLGALARTLKSTNPIENMNGAVAHHTRNVRRWRDGQMVLRWVGAALHEAQRGFRRIRGHRDLRKLCIALERQRNVPIVTSDRRAA